MQKINKKGSVYSDAFYEVFKAMQLSGLYTLYYDVDLSKDELKEFNEFFIEHNREDLSHSIEKSSIREDIYEYLRMDCRKEAESFPYLVKVKMYGKKVSSKNIVNVSAAATDAIELYLLMGIRTMMRDYNFSQEKINLWLVKLKEFCSLYAEGMKTDHVFKYFIQECDLTITE